MVQVTVNETNTDLIYFLNWGRINKQEFVQFRPISLGCDFQTSVKRRLPARTDSASRRGEGRYFPPLVSSSGVRIVNKFKHQHIESRCLGRPGF